MFRVEEEQRTVFEIAVVVPKRAVKEGDVKFDAVEVLVEELKGVGFVIERVAGLTDEFIKLAAPLETLGKAAEELHMKKPTCIGMDLQFQLEDVDVFVREPDGSLFSWRERYLCYHHLLYSIINGSQCKVILKSDGKEVLWKVGEPLLQSLELAGIVKQVFPLHDEVQRKKLLRSWVLNWRNLTNQPIDDMYAYFGLKIAVFFAFLRMYTRWILFPALLGLIVQLVNIESLRLVQLPLFYISITLWSAIFFQFWKRKNSALLARWHIDRSGGSDQAYISSFEWAPLGSPLEIFKGLGIDKMEEREAYQRHEWYGHLMRLRNNAVIILSIICLQLPFELAYAHLYEVMGSEIMKFGLTAVYLILIQYFTSIGGNISVKLVQYENSINTEKQSDSVVYKVFGLYFMQSYIGVFYHAVLHRDFKTLRQVLVQRLIIYQVFDKLMGNLLPYLKYSYKKYRAVRNKKKRDRGSMEGKIQFSSKVEKEYLKPAYSASIAGELEDGLFDDILQLALQFGMIMMFACAFPLAFALAAVNNFIEIRTVALKLLTTMKRPVPRCAPTIGAWLNIFQFLIIMSICTNSALLVCLYDQEGKWKIEPGLAAILIMEHVLLLIKFGCSRFVPEEPAWVKANRMKNASQAQDVCSRQLLRTISSEKVCELLKTD